MANSLTKHAPEIAALDEEWRNKRVAPYRGVSTDPKAIALGDELQRKQNALEWFPRRGPETQERLEERAHPVNMPGQLPPMSPHGGAPVVEPADEVQADPYMIPVVEPADEPQEAIEQLVQELPPSREPPPETGPRTQELIEFPDEDIGELTRKSYGAPEPKSEAEKSFDAMTAKYGGTPEKFEELAKKKGVGSPGPGAAGIARTAWGKFPENLRPEILAGGLQVYPQGDYNKMLDDAVASGQINPQQRKMASNAYKKWTRTLWGATVDHNRLSREMKWIGGREQADVAMIRSNEAAQAAETEREWTESVKDYEGEYRAYQSEYRADYDRMLVKQDEAIDELSQMRIDPDRWFASKGTGGKIMAVIGMGLGSLGASFSKGPNWAFQMIQSQIGNDLAAQRTDIGTVQSSIRARSNLIGFFDRRLKNLDQSTKMSRMFLNDYYTGKIRLLGANATSEVQRRHYESLMEMMAKDREVLGAGVRKGAALLAQQRARASAAARARKKGRYQPGMLLTKQMEAQLIPSGKDKVLRLKGAAPAEMKEIRMQIQSARRVSEINAELHSILDGHTSAERFLSSMNDVRRAEALAGEMKLIMAKERGKQFTEMEAAMVERAGAGWAQGRFVQMYRDILHGKKPGGDLVLPSDQLVSGLRHSINSTLGAYDVVQYAVGHGEKQAKVDGMLVTVPATYVAAMGNPRAGGTHGSGFDFTATLGFVPKVREISDAQIREQLGQKTDQKKSGISRGAIDYSMPWD